MESRSRSPRITHLSWGQLQAEGGCTFKDAKLFPGGAREWDWSETGTAHEPGIQPSDVTELLEHGAAVVVLTKGMYERLRICPETLELLGHRGVTVHVLQTEEALGVYNRLVETDRVGGLFHSTC